VENRADMRVCQYALRQEEHRADFPLVETADVGRRRARLLVALRGVLFGTHGRLLLVHGCTSQRCAQTVRQGSAPLDGCLDLGRSTADRVGRATAPESSMRLIAVTWMMASSAEECVWRSRRWDDVLRTCVCMELGEKSCRLLLDTWLAAEKYSKSKKTIVQVPPKKDFGLCIGVVTSAAVLIALSLEQSLWLDC